MTNLKFFKSTVAPTSAEVGSIWFNSSSKLLNVKTATGWEVYDGGRNVTDASLSNGILTINKADGSNVVLNFSDVASASEVGKYFETLNGGDTVEGSIKYTAKSYADAAQTAAEATAAADATTKADAAKAAANSYTDTKVAEAKVEYDKKVASVAAGDKSITVAGTSTAPTVAVKLSANAGVLKLESDGLSAVVPDETPYTGSNAIAVNDHAISLKLVDDKILSQSANGLTAAFSIAINKKADNKTYIQAIGNDNTTVIAEADASQFLIDGMLDSAAFDEASHVLTLTFNTSAGKNPLTVDLSSLVDVYTASNGVKKVGSDFQINLATSDEGYLKADASGLRTEGITTAISTAKSEAISDAEDKIATAKSEAISTAASDATSKVTELKNTVNAYTVNEKAISGNPTLDGTDILVGGTGTNKAKALNVAVEDLYTKVADAQSSGVTSFGEKTGAITLAAAGTTNGSVNLSMTNNVLAASIVGLGTAAYKNVADFDASGAADAVLGTASDDATKKTVYGAIKLAETKITPAEVDTKISTAAANYATKAQGTKADNALQSVSASGANYITASAGAKADNAQSISVSATIQKVSSSSDSAMGLAEASDVKDYVDNHVATTLAWAEFN